MNEHEIYVGTKTILARAMTRQEYNDYRGWKLPDDETHLADEKGYLVEYTNGGRANHANHKGYIYWFPAAVFDEAYQCNGSLSFSSALTLLKQGKKLTRKGWNGKGQYVVANPQVTPTEASKIWNPHNRKHAESLGGSIGVLPYCTLKNAQDMLAMGWLPSTGDLFAEDWLEID